jgi:hypothetical protein
MMGDLATRGVLAILVAASIACGGADAPGLAGEADAPGPDASADTAPPRLGPASVDPVVPAAVIDVGHEDAPDYVLPPDSITTCGGFFECVSACPPEVGNCTPACHDAMTPYAASLVQALISCVNSNGCQDEHCAMHECAAQMAACFAPQQ